MDRHRVFRQAQVMPFAPDGDALDPAFGSGRINPQVEPVAVGIHARVSRRLDLGPGERVERMPPLRFICYMPFRVPFISGLTRINADGYGPYRKVVS